MTDVLAEKPSKFYPIDDVKRLFVNKRKQPWTSGKTYKHKKEAQSNKETEILNDEGVGASMDVEFNFLPFATQGKPGTCKRYRRWL